MTPQINHLGETRPLLRVPTAIYTDSKQIDRKTFSVIVNLGMSPLKSIILENEPCSEDFNTHLWCSQEDRWQNIHSYSTYQNMTSQIDHLGKMNHVLRVLTHICRVSKEIDGKTCISDEPRHVTPQINHLGKMSPVLINPPGQ